MTTTTKKTKTWIAIPLLAVTLALSACESDTGTALLGGIGGAAVGAGGYEYHLNEQKKKVEQAYKAGTIDQREYEIRLDQIRRDSLIQ